MWCYWQTQVLCKTSIKSLDTMGYICFAICGILALNGRIMWIPLCNHSTKLKKTKKTDYAWTVKTWTLVIDLYIALYWKALSYFKLQEIQLILHWKSIRWIYFSINVFALLERSSFSIKVNKFWIALE